MMSRSRIHPQLARACLALLGVAVALALDMGQRPATPQPARAAYPSAAQGLVPAALQPLGQGQIPMPEGALSAHASNLLAMPAGHAAALTAFWFAGDRESAPNVQIAASQFDRASQRWLPSVIVLNRHTLAQQLGFGVRRLGNPVAWLDASGRMHLFVVGTGLGGWAAARIVHLQQEGDSNALAQLHFKPVGVLPLSWLWNTSFLVRNAPLALQDGGMVLPAHFEIGIKYPVALRFDREGVFQGVVRLSRQAHMLQPTFLAQSPTHWLALMRDTRPDGHITVAQSDDGGLQWSDVPDLALTNPDAAVAALGLSFDQMLLVHNSSPHSRALLDLSASHNGLQWETLLPLAHGGAGDEYSYPSLAWADGSVWLSYTDHRHSIAWQRLGPAGAAP